MASSLVNLAAEVTFTLGGRADLATIAKTFVNRSYQRLQDLVEFPEAHVMLTFPTIASTATYALATVAPNFFSIIDVRNNTTGKRLSQISVPRYDRLSRTVLGSPVSYALRGRTSLLLWNTPLGIETIELNYRKTLTALAADGDVHVLPDAWEEAIIFGATAYGFEYLNELERARQARNSLRATISALSDRLASDLTDRDEPISPVGIQTGVVG